MNTSGTLRCKPLGVFLLFVAFILLYLAVFRDSSSSDIQNALSHDRISLRTLLSVAIEAAVLGGNEVRAVRRLADMEQKSKGKTKEGVNDPVTAGDMRSHRVMYSLLTGSFPGLKVVSEEHDVDDYEKTPPSNGAAFYDAVAGILTRDDSLTARDLTVWIDPLDATKEYTENLLEYVTTMVCVAQNGRPVAGVIHRPFQNSTYWAWVGQGHSRNLNTRHESAQSPLRVVVSISHKGDVEKFVSEKLGETAAKVYDAAGAGYKSLDVVEGKADAYVHTTAIKKWDTCAGNAILAALGGSMTTLKGRRVIDYSSDEAVKITDGLLASFYPDKFSKLQ